MDDAVFLNTGGEIAGKVRELIAGQPDDAPFLMIVAFWGQGSEELFVPGKAYKLVCNLSMGGTNPTVIQQLMAGDEYQIEVRHLPDLHAKVCLGKHGAVVSSANFSNQGLGLQQSSVHWVEAGAHIPSSSRACEDINQWAWDVWLKAKPVTQADLRDALAVFNARLARDIDVSQEVSGETGAGVAEAQDFGLTESMLFRPENETNPENALRAGSRELLRLYGQYLEREPSKRETWVVAYVANLLWTHTGNSSPWRDGVFQLPQDVVRRWRETKTTDRQVFEFLSWLADAEVTPQPIQQAARDLIGGHWEQYVG